MRGRRFHGLVLLALATLWPAGLQAESAADGMVTIPAGPFVMGADPRDGALGFSIGVDSIPRHERTLPAFRIDRFEATHEAYREFVHDTGRALPEDPKFADFFAWKDGDYPAGLGRHPVVYVSWNDAHDYCAWRGVRLPTEAEWEKAARGTDGRNFVSDAPPDAGHCNTLESGIGWTVPVGGLDGDVSPYGVHDMCGNVSEWTDSWYQPYPGSTLEREAFGETYKVARGGAFMLESDPFTRVTNRSLAFAPDKRHRSIGFRCAADIGP
ncbi:MAG: formylglycine-generating enzyme family protein [Leptospirillia bacterium]